MKLHRAFTLIELLVVVAVIALLIAILIPSLGKARKQARTSVCMTNERALVQSYRIYYQENQTVLSTTGHSGMGAWDYQLLGGNLSQAVYYPRNGKGDSSDRIRFCPETPSVRRGTSTSLGTAALNWDCHAGSYGGSTGSYSLNNWLYKPGTGANGDDYYKIKNAMRENSIPVFVDSVWHDFRPSPQDLPGLDLSDPEAGSTRADRKLGDAAIDRHSKAVNVSFWDGHVDTIKLRELWLVNWSQSWRPPSQLPRI